jgi:hypothetical protein
MESVNISGPVVIAVRFPAGFIQREVRCDRI